MKRDVSRCIMKFEGLLLFYKTLLRVVRNMRVLLVVLISRFYSIRLIYTRWKRIVLTLQESLFLRFFSSSCAYIESLLSLFITGIPFDSWKYSTWNIIIRDTKNLMFTIFENSLLSSEIKKIDKLISSYVKIKNEEGCDR